MESKSLKDTDSPVVVLTLNFFLNYLLLFLLIFIYSIDIESIYISQVILSK